MNKTKKFALFFLVFFITACGAKENALGKEDFGRQVELREGEKILITLDANPTTGYQWEIVEVDNSILKQVGEAEYDADSPKLVGSGGEENFRFEAVGTGVTDLQLIYHQPWETVPPVDTFSLTIVVK